MCRPATTSCGFSSEEFEEVFAYVLHRSAYELQDEVMTAQEVAARFGVGARYVRSVVESER